MLFVDAHASVGVCSVSFSSSFFLPVFVLLCFDLLLFALLFLGLSLLVSSFLLLLGLSLSLVRFFLLVTGLSLSFSGSLLVCFLEFFLVDLGEFSAPQICFVVVFGVFVDFVDFVVAFSVLLGVDCMHCHETKEKRGDNEERVLGGRKFRGGGGAGIGGKK